MPLESDRQKLLASLPSGLKGTRSETRIVVVVVELVFDVVEVDVDVVSSDVVVVEDEVDVELLVEDEVVELDVDEEVLVEVVVVVTGGVWLTT